MFFFIDITFEFFYRFIVEYITNQSHAFFHVEMGMIVTSTHGNTSTFLTSENQQKITLDTEILIWNCQ